MTAFPRPQPASLRPSDRAGLWIAEGFGLGRIRWAPGTWGTLGGVAWFALLAVLPSPWFFCPGALIGVAVSVWLGGKAEVWLQRKDPGSVVIDEIAAFPLCLLVPALAHWHATGLWPGPAFWFGTDGGFWTVLAFALFRLFDVWKPWPVYPSQNLPAGWGITLDDCLAAGYVNLVLFLLPGRF
ncbi:MAG TPA: phosphatidylglycerophosphatase A [Candidatus Paceibacterota bacterium]|nr:phosphatidylglycerophosphatase A [Candidatus Paceibacterota bacterium]